MSIHSLRITLEKTTDLRNIGEIHHNCTIPTLYEHALFLEEGLISANGALVVSTLPYTSRSTFDKFIVEEPGAKEKIAWGEFTRSLTSEKFSALKARIGAYLQGRDIYVQDCFAGSDPKYRLALRVITEHAWQSLFVRNMFIEPEKRELSKFDARFTIICVPKFQTMPEIDGTRSGVSIVIDFSQRIAYICGTSYAGELKKVVFTLMNFLLPNKRVFPMHCAANIGAKGDTALFFGLPGTGKTTLSNDPDRKLIGDDEHGWADEGVFNIEGGCYTKVSGITADSDPLVVQMTKTFGTILENGTIDPIERGVHLGDFSKTDNARASYSREQLRLAGDIIVQRNKGPHPKNIFFLTADAFGVLPPIARLSLEQALFFFLTGYTSKLSGSEKSVKEPTATFNACFSDSFTVLSPLAYASMFKHRLQKNRTRVWLINTGWTGGEYGNKDGKARRIKLEHTRLLIQAVLQGVFEQAEFITGPILNLSIPQHCQGVPSELLHPRMGWTKGEIYDSTATKLQTLLKEYFMTNFPDAEPQWLLSVETKNQPASDKAVKSEQREKQSSRLPVKSEERYDENIMMTSDDQRGTSRQQRGKRMQKPAPKAHPRSQSVAPHSADLRQRESQQRETTAQAPPPRQIEPPANVKRDAQPHPTVVKKTAGGSKISRVNNNNPAPTLPKKAQERPVPIEEKHTGEQGRKNVPTARKKPLKRRTS